MTSLPLQHVIALGTDFDDDRVVGCTYGSGQTALGQDIILWDPEGLVREYDAHNDDLGAPAAQRLTRDRARRDSEIGEHLRGGKPVVIFMPAPARFGLPDEDHWRDVSELFPVSVETEVSRGRAFELISGDPFASFWKRWAPSFEHHAELTKTPGTPLLRIRGTYRVVASLAPVDNGLVLLLPALVDVATSDPSDDATESDFLDALWEMLRGLRGTAVLPPWTDDYALVGEQPAVQRLEAARQRLRRAEKTIEKEEQKLAALRERKLLFAGSGIALENLVEQAFEALGFVIEPSDPLRSDRVLRRKRRYAVVEVKGKAKSASERDAAQLEKWVSGYHADTGRRAKGILVINAWRNKRLEDREDEPSFPSQMLKFAAEERKQCLLTGLQVLGLWLAAEADPKKVDRLASSILSCDGPYPAFNDWREILERSSGS